MVASAALLLRHALESSKVVLGRTFSEPGSDIVCGRAVDFDVRKSGVEGDKRERGRRAERLIMTSAQWEVAMLGRRGLR